MARSSSNIDRTTQSAIDATGDVEAGLSGAGERIGQSGGFGNRLSEFVGNAVSNFRNAIFGGGGSDYSSESYDDYSEEVTQAAAAEERAAQEAAARQAAEEKAAAERAAAERAARQAENLARVQAKDRQIADGSSSNIGWRSGTSQAPAMKYLTQDKEGNYKPLNSVWTKQAVSELENIVGDQIQREQGRPYYRSELESLADKYVKGNPKLYKSKQPTTQPSVDLNNQESTQLSELSVNQDERSPYSVDPSGQIYDRETAEKIDLNLSENELSDMDPVQREYYERAREESANIRRGAKRQAEDDKREAARRQSSNRQQVSQSEEQEDRSQEQEQEQRSSNVVSRLANRQIADNLFNSMAAENEEHATAFNESIRNNFDQWVEQHPMATGVQFPQWVLDVESFDNESEPLMRSGYRNLEEYESGVEQSENDNKLIRFNRMIDNLVSDMKVGFFHITTEKVVTDKSTGKSVMRWSAPVENAMTNVMEDFNLHGVNGQRTVFRLVRMYASMGVDADGRMFNQNENEWSLSEQEFVDICEMIRMSCRIYGHPMGMPLTRYQLRGTDVYPSGVMPLVVAKELTKEGSILDDMSPSDLVQACMDEWNGRTYPTLVANLRSSGTVNPETGVIEGNQIAQRVAIERMQQALSRLDGMSAEDFSRRYRIDTNTYHKLEDYQNAIIAGVTTANGNYDSEAVANKLIERTDYYKKQAQKQKGVNFNDEGVTETIVIEGDKKVSNVTAGANLISAVAKINSLLGLPILAPVSIMEKGAGNIRTKFGLNILRALSQDGSEKYTVSDRAYDRMKTEEAAKALDAAKILFEIGGPGAARRFSQTGRACTQANVVQFLEQEYLVDSSSSFVAQKLKDLQKISQKLMVGDYAFRKDDSVNWFNALLIDNATRGNVQDKMSRDGVVDKSGEYALTGAEIEDIMNAHTDIAGFFTEMLGHSSGISAFNMMRANSIAQVNPISYYTGRFLRDHGVTNAMITLFIDTFPIYGLNYIYNIVPFSRTLTYIAVKKTQSNQTDNAIQNADLVIGGNFNDTGIDINDPGFQAGLKQNLLFDAVTFGHNMLVGGILGLAFLALGFEPPEDGDDLYNISKWKIGKNIGVGADRDGDGKGDGVEIQWAWWLNDLTLLGMPFAYFIAVGHKTKNWQLAGDAMLDSLYDQLEGNVILDFTDMIVNWRNHIMTMDEMSKQENYDGPTDILGFGMSQLYAGALNGLTKITPGAPLMRTFNNSALLRGIDARVPDPRKVYDKSAEWKEELGVTKNVDSYYEYLTRKYSVNNWLLALAANGVQSMLAPDNEERTGFFANEMPVRTAGDPLSYVWAGIFHMDYDNKEDPSITDAQYDAEMAQQVLYYIDQFQEMGLSPREANATYGFIITPDARKACLNYLYDVELATLDEEWINRNASGELADKNDYQVAKGIYYDRRDEINTKIYDWLKNDEIPTWGEEYELILTDYDVSYVYKDTGKPVPHGAFSQFDPNVEAVWEPKGNHPTSIFPFTIVDYTDNIMKKGGNAETANYWRDENDPAGQAEALRNMVLPDGTNLVDQIIPYGRDSGEKLGDVLFGGQPKTVLTEEGYTHPEGSTMGHRSYVPKKRELPDDIKDIGKEYEDEWNEKKNAITNAAWSGGGSDGGYGYYGGSTLYPRSSYGSGYSQSYGYSNTINYNPKIYNTKVYNDNTSNTRVYNNSRVSNSRVNNTKVYSSKAGNVGKINSTHGSSSKISNSPRQVGADRASGMQVRNPQSTHNTYLRPGFSTKGSREAYKRQDI